MLSKFKNYIQPWLFFILIILLVSCDPGEKYLGEYTGVYYNNCCYTTHDTIVDYTITVEKAHKEGHINVFNKDFTVYENGYCSIEGIQVYSSTYLAFQGDSIFYSTQSTYVSGSTPAYHVIFRGKKK
jgi:hypothetical protein